MKLVLIIIGISFFLFSLVIALFWWIKNKEEDTVTSLNDDNMIAKKYKLNWKVYFLLILSVVLVFSSFLAPAVFTTVAPTSGLNFRETGQIGDTIGGLMNPFIAIAGIIITGLAFYIQYKANEQQRDLFVLEQVENKKQLQTQIDTQKEQIQIQQIESQFYEMLKLHRENISEMRINGYDFEEGEFLKKFEKITEGRKVFVTMKTELEFILHLYKKDHELDLIGFQKCYKIFFSGLDEFEKKYPTDKTFSDTLRLARAQHTNPRNTIKTNSARKNFIPGLDLNFNYKPFSGHASRLGHYFRHLYLTVKSIANSNVIKDYDEKMKYLRLLRAQLSNHEQILLFYNWLSEYGQDWENDEHKFFTEFCMIHNLWWDNLLKDNFINNKVNYLRTQKVIFRKGKMFEID